MPFLWSLDWSYMVAGNMYSDVNLFCVVSADKHMKCLTLNFFPDPQIFVWTPVPTLAYILIDFFNIIWWSVSNTFCFPVLLESISQEIWLFVTVPLSRKKNCWIFASDLCKLFWHLWHFPEARSSQNLTNCLVMWYF